MRVSTNSKQCETEFLESSCECVCEAGWDVKGQVPLKKEVEQRSC